MWSVFTIGENVLLMQWTEYAKQCQQIVEFTDDHHGIGKIYIILDTFGFSCPL